MGLAFCGALFLRAAKLAKVLQRNCKNCTVYIETAGRVWYALGVGRLPNPKGALVMKRTLRTKIWCAVLAVACVSGVAFGVANLPRVQAEAGSGGVEGTEAPGNEAVVSEESKAEVPEISGNPEISEVSETAEVSSAKEEFESHFTADEKLDFSKIPKIVRTEDGSISIENGDGSFDAENDPYLSASSIYGG